MDLLATDLESPRRDHPPGSDAVVEAMREIAAARDLAGVMASVRRNARRLVRADGATFVLREGAVVHYADEDAISPLWKGRRFPADACASGWAMNHRTSLAILDVFADPRVPADAYRRTFVRSLALVPIRREDPLGAIGAYWARPHLATPREVAVLEALAEVAAVAIANADLLVRLERAVRLRDEFLALAAHELNTPLAAVRLRADALVRAAARAGEAPPPELEPLQGTLTRLTGAVGGLLEFSRASREGITPVRANADLAEVAREAVADLSARAEATGTEVHLRAPAAVPGRWDRALLRRAVGHLVENAVKFGPGRPVDVEVGEAAGEARVRVRDRGPGIGEQDRERIFGKFERAAPAEHVGGLGLGLWLAREIAEAHGGTIEVESPSGDGAAFTLSLPTRLLSDR